MKAQNARTKEYLIFQFRKFIPVKFKKVIKRILLAWQIIKWRWLKLGVSNAQSYNASFLVIKNIEYCQLAQISVLSFLYFHRNSHVKIFCDETTGPLLKRIFKREIKQGYVSIFEPDFLGASWQEAKIAVISDLKGPNGIYVDADMRFNGRLKLNQELIFFVEEFSLESLHPFSLLSDLWRRFNENLPCAMLNTSLIYNGGSNQEFFKKSTLKNFHNFQCELRLEIESSKLKENEKVQIWRLREQLFLSLIAQQSKVKVSFVKQLDSRLDGTIVESSYYGSTGLGF